MRHARFIRATTPLLILAVILWSAFCFIPQAHAATIAITSCPTGTALHNNVASASPGDTIQFRISGSPCTIDLSGAGGGTLIIGKNLTFDASGSPQPVTLSGGQSVQVLQVGSGVTFTLQNLIIANGFDATNGGGGLLNNGGLVNITNVTFSHNTASNRVGGGLYNHGGSVTISSSTFSNNTATDGFGLGGGLFNQGTVTITNSTFSNNTATNGGGIDNNNGGTMTISNSTIANNNSPNGGGIANFGGTLTISNSTIANNTSSQGGGISNSFGTVTISNSTIANNTASQGGGIGNNGGTVNIGASIVANNTAQNGVGAGNCAGTSLTDQGYNLESGTDCNFRGATDQHTTDPQFQGGLQNNGGPTQTIALQLSSPAVDKIPVNTGHGCITGGTDQRGRLRPDHDLLLLPEATCDIGAYEVQDLL